MDKLRIISLVPSLSETLVDLGLREQLFGCTQFCVEPPDLHRSCKIVGGTKDFSIEAIRTLSPTHIIANQEENTQALVEEMQMRWPVLLTFPKGPHDVPSMLRDMGDFLNRAGEFSAASSALEALLSRPVPQAPIKTFVYLIWRDPYMLAGRDTYISRLLESFSWKNAYEGEQRYPALTLDELKILKPDVVFLSSEPYPFRKRDAERLRAEWEKAPELLKIDGRLMSWFGTSTARAWDMLTASAFSSL